MKNLLIYDKKRSIKFRIDLADSFGKRLKGLMLKKELAVDTGLMIVPCNSIHMCFMKFSIDVIFIDKNYRILKLAENLKPWLGMSICRGSWGAIELPAGTISKYNIDKKNTLRME